MALNHEQARFHFHAMCQVLRSTGKGHGNTYYRGFMLMQRRLLGKAEDQRLNPGKGGQGCLCEFGGSPKVASDHASVGAGDSTKEASINAKPWAGFCQDTSTDNPALCWWLQAP